MENPLFQRFPFAVYNTDWEIWFWAIFMLEGVAALLIALMLQHKRLPKAPGSKAKIFLILLCAGQTFFEMLREDGYLRLDPWFIRITQLGALVALIGMMVSACIHWKWISAEKRISGKSVALSWLIFVACIGVDVWMQFAVQKSADLPVWACFAIMAVCSLGFGAISYRMVFHHELKK